MSGSAASIREAANGGLDTVLSYLYHYELAENIENGRILNTDHYAYLIGNSLDNILYSNSNSNYLDGGIGSDTADFSYATSGISINLNDEYKFISIENATGSSYADYIAGNSSNNILNGAAGSDTVNYATATSAVNVSLAISTAQVTGGGGTDTLISIENLIGSDFNDTLAGNSGNNTLNGAAGSDTVNYAAATSAVNVSLAISTAQVTGGGGTDTLISIENLTGSDFSDTLAGNSGNNTLNGAAGSDTVSYATATSAVHVSLAISTAQVTGGGGTDTLISIENLSGSAHNDRLTGDDAANKLSGGAGNDILNGGAGADKLIGGDGSDIYYVDSTSDVISETNANLSIGGNDTVYSYLSEYTLGTNIENGRVLAGDTSSLIGNSLNNILYAGAGNNVLNGGAGSDTVSYLYASSAVTVTLASAAAQATGGSDSDMLIAIENLTGSSYNDSLTGDAADNTLSGGAGDDILNGRAGADKLIGGDGSDIYYVDNASDLVSETNASLSTGGSDTVYSYLSKYTLGANIENGRIVAGGNASLTGNSLNNILYAGAGSNVLNGGTGSDSVSYLYASSAVTVTLASSAAQATGGSGSDTLIAIESLIGSNYNDKLTGNSASNRLSGGLGNDVLNGGAGSDKMIGGEGSDTYYVDNAGDVVSETNADASTGGTDTVYSYLTSYSLGTNIENGRILAAGSANLSGNNLNNVLVAGIGNNILNGSDGTDTVSYTHASSAVTVSLNSTSAQATKGSGSDTLISIENLAGSQYNDSLTGNAASNTLNGGAGNDRLIGGAGKDLLIGGAGNDTFVINALSDSGLTSDNWDVIKDFMSGDKIDLSRLDADTTVDGNNVFTQIIDSAAAFTAAGQLRLTDGVLYGNIDGDADAEFAIQLVGVTSVSLADFTA
ncbi:hypothetical protein OH686_14530 [Pseudomonas sp. SO81]|nr:hypothetical protein OH686_14530 [Pseudomonas sp. SO81]